MTLLVDRRDLLLRFRTGDRAALEEVYRHYAPAVARFLGHGFTFRSGDEMLRFAGFTQPFDLDNVLAETFVRAFRESARLAYDGLRPFKGYLLTIARNLVLDELRLREDAAGDATEVAATAADELLEESAEHDLLRGELGALYGRFRDALAERDRAFFDARFEEQATQVDAGRLAGLSHMQARTLEKKLRARFLSFMQSRGYLEGAGGDERRAGGPHG